MIRHDRDGLGPRRRIDWTALGFFLAAGLVLLLAWWGE
jgi:hypothetical protein